MHNTCGREFSQSPKNYIQVITYLKNRGFKIVSQNGSHVKMTDGEHITIIPNHGAKDIPKGTLRSIMKQAGIM